MPSASLTYRLRIRTASGPGNPDGSSDALVVTSLRGGTNPFIAEPPRGDGLEVDPIRGGVRSGAYTVLVTDPITSGSSRLVTSQLADSANRNQLLSRRAFVELSTDGGSTFTTVQAGYVLGLRLVDAITYEVTVGDTRRIEQQRTIFELDDPTYFPVRGAVLGGPLIGGAFGPFPQRNGLVYQVTSNQSVTGFPANTRVIEAKFLTGYTTNGQLTTRWQDVVNPFGGKNTSRTDIDEWASSYYTQFTIPSRTITIGTLGAYFPPGIQFAGMFPGLVYRVYGFGTNTTLGNFLPLQVTSGNIGGQFISMMWDPASSAPSVGTLIRVSLLTERVSEDCPLYVSAHPVDVVRRLYQQADIPIDVQSFDNLRDLIGPQLRVSLRITKPSTLAKFIEESLAGPFGIGLRVRTTAESVPPGDPPRLPGQVSAFSTRIKTASLPTATVNTNSLIDQGVVFELDEGTVINKVSLTTETLSLYDASRYPLVQGRPSVTPPRDGVLSSTETYEVVNADVSVFGQRDISYTVPGMIHTADAFTSVGFLFSTALAGEIFDRYGRGVQAADLPCLRGAGLDSVTVGDEIYVQPAHLPNANKRFGDDASVGARIMQVVRRTETPEGPELRVLDSGTNAQPATAATVSLAASAQFPQQVAEFTITNAATLNTGGINVAVEWATGPSQPTTDGEDFARYTAPDVPTGAVSLFPVTPGSTVWVRVRSEQPGRRPSAWSTWATVTLSALAVPTGLTASDIKQNAVTLTWTNTDTTQSVRVRVAPSSASSTSDDAWIIADLPPGTTRAVVRGLSGPSVAHTALAGYVTPEGYVGGNASTTFTTSSTSDTSLRPAGIAILSSTGPADDAGLPSGVAVAAWSADPAYQLVLERAPDVAGSPGTYAEIAVVPGTTEVYVDPLPLDGVTRWYRWRHRLSGYDDSGPTCGRSAVPGGVAPGIARPELVLPSVRAENSEVGTTATVTLDIDDPQCRVVEVRFRHRVQPSAWSSYTVDTTVPYSYSETIPTTGFLEIEWEVRGYDSTGTFVTLATAIEYFDADSLPGVVGISASFNESGQLVVALNADSDSASMKFAVGTGSTVPDLTATRAGTLVNARSTVGIVLGPYAIGTQVNISALAYAGANATGAESGLFTYRIVRDGARPQITGIAVTFDDDGAAQLVITADANVGSIKFATSTSGVPSLGTVQAATPTNGRQVSTSLAGPFPIGTTLYVAALAYREAAGAGDEGALSSGAFLRDGAPPQVTSISVTFTTVGQGILVVTGDGNVGSLKFATSTSAAPNLATVQAASAVNGRQASATLTGPFNVGTTVYVSALAYRGTGGAGEEGPLTSIAFVRQGDDLRVVEDLAESATAGTLDLTVYDPTQKVASVRARGMIGHGAWGSYSTLTNTGTATVRQHQATVTLVEKVPSKIEYQVLGPDLTGGTNQVLATNIVTFAMGTKPFIPDLFVTVREDGTVDALVQGDSDTASIRIGYSTASQATADTNAASATAVNGRTRTALDIGSLTLGQKAFVSALAYSGTGGTGEVSEVAQAEIVRANVSSTRTVRWNTAGAFQPQFPSTTSVARDLFGYIPMINLNGTAFHFATLPVPIGATLQAVTVRVNLFLAFAGTGSVTMRLYRLQDDGDSTQLGTDQVISANGTQTLTVGSLSESVTATRSYVVELQADSSDTDNLATAFYSDITYLSPNLTVNL
jgi:hypothetical protein